MINDIYISFQVAQKMINRLLTLDRIKTALDEGKAINYVLDNKPEVRLKPFTKEELAKKLGISVKELEELKSPDFKELEELKSPDFYESIASKISLSLTSLYCATKFADGEYKSEQGGNHE